MHQRMNSIACSLLLAAGATVANPQNARADGLDDAFAGGVRHAQPSFDPTTSNKFASPNRIAPGFKLVPLVSGTDPLENPSGVITTWGYLDNGTNLESSTKTEPDENLYVVLNRNPGGPTPHYQYGRHFLFQGHENAGDVAFVSRINLDVEDPAHRITLLTPVGDDGRTGLNRIDGSTWDPFTQTLLFTQENRAAGGVVEVTSSWPPARRALDGSFGQAGYEGIHPDHRGNLVIVEDAGGTRVRIDPDDTNSVQAAAVPNSFVYRFVPRSPWDLGSGGRLQALQVSIDGGPLKFVQVDAEHPSGDAFSHNQLKLHTRGTSWHCRWVTVHDTAVDGTTSFNANTAAKAAGATPFKRPENAQFLPGSDFRTLFFCVTGDTDARSGAVPALAARGAWGGFFRVDFDASGDAGRISIFYLGDSVHNSFDNVAFVNGRILLATEDRGDGLHLQLNTLDSIWAFDVTQPRATPVRFVALGRDEASLIGGEDNEPTGLHISDGASSIRGLLGTNRQLDGTRWFFTQQHGDNTLFEVVPAEDDREQR